MVISRRIRYKVTPDAEISMMSPIGRVTISAGRKSEVVANRDYLKNFLYLMHAISI